MPDDPQGGFTRNQLVSLAYWALRGGMSAAEALFNLTRTHFNLGNAQAESIVAQAARLFPFVKPRHPKPPPPARQITVRAKVKLAEKYQRREPRHGETAWVSVLVDVPLPSTPGTIKEEIYWAARSIAEREGTEIATDESGNEVSPVIVPPFGMFFPRGGR